MKCEKCKLPDDSPAVCIHMSGKKGGQVNRDRKLAEDPDYYRKLGKRGGAKVKELYGKGFYEEIGKKGGATVMANRGKAFYEEIGTKGGETVKAKYGKRFYETIGTKGGHKVRDMIELGKQAEAAAGEKAK